MVHFNEIQESHSYDFRVVCLRTITKQEKFLYPWQKNPILIVYLNQMQISKTQNGLTTGVLNRNILATIASEYKNYSEAFVFHQFV